MKIDEILADDIKTLLAKNGKWWLSFFIRYGFVALMGTLLFIFLYGNIKGGNFVTGPGVVVKRGKTINITKISEDTNIEDEKEIEDTIEYLKSLKKQGIKK